MKYTEKVLDHFKSPRNVGIMENADGVGEIGNPACGDIMTFYIKVNDDKLEDIKFQTFGCGAAIAVSSMISEMAKGKTIEDAVKISNKDVAEALDGLPKNKLHCSNLGADALQAAIRNYYEGKQEGTPVTLKEKKAHEHETCKCPYCDIENPGDVPFCTACGAEISGG